MKRRNIRCIPFALAIFFVGILPSSILVVSLFYQKRNIPMVGWLILLTHFLFITLVALCYSRFTSGKDDLKSSATDSNVKTAQNKRSDDFINSNK
jgi:magnesium-transporting ATPase (P-type)